MAPYNIEDIVSSWRISGNRIQTSADRTIGIMSGKAEVEIMEKLFERHTQMTLLMKQIKIMAEKDIHQSDRKNLISAINKILDP